MVEKNKYSERLLEEWKTHKMIIIGVDFDDTLKNWKLGDHDTIDRTLDLVRKCQATGAYITIFTACNEDRYDEIHRYCESHQIKVNSINKNPIQLQYGNNSKIYANIFLDDRAGINEALTTLETALYEYRAYLQKETININNIE